MTRFAHGRWDREQPHSIEIKSDPPACWAVCTCGFEGTLQQSTEAADADAIAHELEVFERRKAGRRLVRGRVE